MIFAAQSVACMSSPHKFSYLIKAFAGLLLFSLAVSCATIVTPSGGEKDIIPPEMTWSDPPNKALNFNKDQLVLGFSEFIQLKDMQKYLMVSPPLNKEPEFRIRKKSLIVKFNDTLRSNTTYNFYFGEGVVDLTESNPLSNFSFAFSTGPVIDSLSLRGYVTEAFTRKAVKEAMVMLYTNLADSAPKLERPVYVSRTNDRGEFELNSLAAGKYRIIAMTDVNGDYMYNLPNETIAFSDSLAEPFYKTESIVTDTLQLQAPAEYPRIALDMFSEPDSVQRVLKAGMTSPHIMSMYFRYPLSAPGFVPLNIDSTLNWCISEFSAGRDTVQSWLTASMPDTLKIKVSDRGIVIDTVEVATLFKPRSEKGKPAIADTTLRFVSSSGRTKQLGWNQPYLLTFSNPVDSMDASKALLYRKESADTLKPKLVLADSLHRRVRIEFPWATQEQYTLLFPAGMFRDIYGQVNDTVRQVFTLVSKDEYGKFRIKMQLINQMYPVIIQLLNEKDLVLQQDIITESQEIDFGFLSPGKYRLKAIFDENRNGRWDTGVFLRHRQPERTAFNPKTFEVRGNWEMEEEWEL